MDRKAEFLKIWTERVQRDYADALLAWLERETDFFEAPASTRHHGAHPGGLLDHSLNVYHRLRAIVCVETAARKDREVKQLPGRSEKITCDKCGRRRYGLPYEVKRVFFTGGSRK